MPVVSYSEILASAERAGYAVGCFDAVDSITLEAYLDTAQRLRSPVILALSQAHLRYVDGEALVRSMLERAKESPVPVSVMMDHCRTAEEGKKAVEWGVNAVLLDMSDAPYDEHVKTMTAFAAYCHDRGVCVEGELGRHGSRWSKEDGGSFASCQKTDPSIVRDYVEKTGVDGLAVYVGNSRSTLDDDARLDYALLDELNRLSPVPLVLHGSSGIDGDDIVKMVSRGICKVNNYTEIARAAICALRDVLAIPTWTEYHALPVVAKRAMVKVVEKKLHLFGCAGKA
ncbi:MAG: class II fructose-bisphosphate aldolase [Christensenellales bacterium]|jgi:fructose-bisphosphate aldolase class II